MFHDKSETSAPEVWDIHGRGLRNVSDLGVREWFGEFVIVSDLGVREWFGGM